MQLPSVLEINERQCPVPENVFAQLYKSNPADAASIAATLGEQQRAQLCAFCYKRMHLSHLAIIIASSCSRAALVSAMGNAGEALYEQSRDPERAIADLHEKNSYSAKKKISLAGFGNRTKKPSQPDPDSNVVPLFS